MSLASRPASALPRETPGVASQTPRLPIRTDEVLAGLDSARTVSLELSYGNTDLIKVLEILGIGGPFTVLSPWELQDETGRHLISAGGYAALPFGEMYPPLVAFVQAYLTRSRAVSLPQQSASPYRAALEANLVALLASQAPSHAESRVFFANSGAEAVEAALKFAKAARPKGRYLINFSRGYHGKTLGALSITPNAEYQAPFRPLLPGVVTLPYGDAEALERTVRKLGPNRITAIVVEPIQGEGGVITPPPAFLPALQEVARRHEIIVIADEIQSGLGRCGHWFASVALGLEPDILTLAKPLGGGLVPVGATVVRQELFRKMLAGLESKRHSNTFGGNSLAMAVGLKSLELLQDEGLIERSRALGERGLAKMRAIQARWPGYIGEVRGAGMLFAVQLRHVLKPGLLKGQAELINTFGSVLALRALHLGGVHACFTLNASGVVRFTPALNMPEPLFDEMFDRLEAVAAEHRAAWTMLPKTPLSTLTRLAKVALSR